MPDVKPILDPIDLAERWGCSTALVAERAEDPARPIPFFIVGDPKSSKKRRRFRLADIERWEADSLRISTRPEAIEPPGRPPGYDGPDYLGERKRGSRRLLR